MLGPRIHGSGYIYYSLNTLVEGIFLSTLENHFVLNPSLMTKAFGLFFILFFLALFS
jgi:hypothetical protein